MVPLLSPGLEEERVAGPSCAGEARAQGSHSPRKGPISHQWPHRPGGGAVWRDAQEAGRICSGCSQEGEGISLVVQWVRIRRRAQIASTFPSLSPHHPLLFSGMVVKSGAAYSGLTSVLPSNRT